MRKEKRLTTKIFRNLANKTYKECSDKNKIKHLICGGGREECNFYIQLNTLNLINLLMPKKME